MGIESLSLYDGPKEAPIAECAALRVERRVQSVKAFVTGNGCLNRNVDAVPADYGRIRIARQQAMIGANLILIDTGFQASAGVQGGAIFYERATLTPVPAIVSAQSSVLHVLGAFGPEFRLLVPARGSRVQGGLVLGADFLTNTLKFGYKETSSGLFRETTRTYTVQPYAALGLALRL